MSNNIWDRISGGSKRLVDDASKNSPSESTTQHVWCSAIVVGSEHCPCPKHKGKKTPEIKTVDSEVKKL